MPISDCDTGTARRIGLGEFRDKVAEVETLDISPAHLLALARLPFHPDHRDPFDHLLVAQAIAEGACLVFADRHAARHAVTILPCSEP